MWKVEFIFVLFCKEFDIVVYGEVVNMMLNMWYVLCICIVEGFDYCVEVCERSLVGFFLVFDINILV